MRRGGVPPHLGVVIASYDRPDRVRRAARSVLRQRGVGELVVVDDGSPVPVDLSGLEDPRLALVRHERNRGVCAARNTGTAAARAERLLYLDDDDRLLPWAAWCLTRWAARAPGAVVVGAVLAERPGRRPILRRPPSSRAGEVWGLDAHLVAGGRSVNTKQAAAIPRRLVEEVGGWDESLRSRSSSEFFYRLTDRADVRGHAVPIYRLDRGGHAKLTADPALRARSHGYIARKHAPLLATDRRRAAFEEAHAAMMTETLGPRTGPSTGSLP